jgi:hypothetical protein
MDGTARHVVRGVQSVRQAQKSDSHDPGLDRVIHFTEQHVEEEKQCRGTMNTMRPLNKELAPKNHEQVRFR